MAALSTVLSPLLLPSPPHRRPNGAALASRFLSPTPLSRWRKNSPSLRRGYPTPHSPPRSASVVAAQSDLFRVIQTAWRIGRDGIEAGADLVPAIVPKPIARICVTGAAVAVALFLLKSFLSTAFFALAMMGFVYFIFIAFNKDEGPRGGGGGGGRGGGGTSTEEETLEEARRIMEKYK